jgi:hypothetical protein
MDLLSLATEYANQGMSLKDMAAKENISYSKLKYLLAGAGYSHPKGIELAELRIIKESGMNLNGFIRYHLAKGVSRNQIAKLSGIDNKSIQLYADHNGIEIPRALSKPLSTDKIKEANQKRDQSKRRDLILITYQGKKQCLADWCRELGLNRSTVKSRLDLGYTIAQAFKSEIRFQRGFSALNALKNHRET